MITTSAKIKHYSSLPFDEEIFPNRFRSSKIDYMGLLVIGRDESLDLNERRRLEWRRQNTVVNSKHIHCLTYDELCEDLGFGLEKYQLSQ